MTDACRVRPSLYCVLSPKQIKFMTQKKCELNAAEIRSIKPNTNYRIKFAQPNRIIVELNYSVRLGFIPRICGV